MQLARKRSGSGPRLILSPIPSVSSLIATSTMQQDITKAAVCDQTMNSILEADTAQLRQHFFVAQSHAKNALLYRGQKLDFENKYNLIYKKMYEDWNLMLIARDDGSSEISSQKWQKGMDKYLGELSSVPAFLSQVTISLVQTLHEERTLSQPSYSVIHDD
ncbi:unnamed protein product, partial [Mesorhabditis belari]|uniref:Uncharacterized protein n=1 Tax=Mesorhabditis belari TaxID=2138241 RepID=A0AAF3EYB9_9BILA